MSSAHAPAPAPAPAPVVIPDLTHADWWIRTTVKMLQNVDNTMRFAVHRIEDTQHLHIQNISEPTLSNLLFMVNTDQNNSYGYLEAMQVFTKNDYSVSEIPVPGLSQLAISIWNNSDSKCFIDGLRTQSPFLNPLINPTNTTQPFSIPQYVDMMTEMIPWLPSTYGQEKVFSLFLNPDEPLKGIAAALAGVGVALTARSLTGGL